MPKITVELDDSDMAELDAEARATRVSPERIIAKTMRDRLSARGRVQPVGVTVVGAVGDVTASEGLASRQAARRAALLPAFGMWADDDTKPKDGVAYQKAMRAEWE